jgi:DisA bacterial checkpoint controller nucleotide-binding
MGQDVDTTRSFISLTDEYGRVDGTKQAVTGRVFKGLHDGLLDYLGSARLALIVWANPDDKRYYIDPSGLVRQHEKAIRGAYDERSAARFQYTPDEQALGFRDLDVQILEDDEFNGLLNVEAQSNIIYHQQWLVEMPKNTCHRGPIRSWVTKAAQELVHDLTYKERVFNKGTEFMLSNFSEEAIFHFLFKTFEKLVPDSMATSREFSVGGVAIQESVKALLPIMSILKSVKKLSAAKEEGASVSGQIVFMMKEDIDTLDKGKYHSIVDAALADGNNMYELHPQLERTKYIGKLLSLSNQDTCLLSDGRLWYLGPVPKHSRAITVRLATGQGELRLGHEKKAVCTFANGRYLGVDKSVDLSKLANVLEGRSISGGQILLRTVQLIVDHARLDRHGCTIVLDLADMPQHLPGPKLTPSLDTTSGEEWIPAVLGGMSRIDGALHLSKTAHLLGFAKILDGDASRSEDRSRGSRYNSAIRFVEKAGNESIVVIVASEDGPVTIVSEETLPYLGDEQYEPACFASDLDGLFAQLDQERKTRELAAKAELGRQPGKKQD